MSHTVSLSNGNPDFAVENDETILDAAIRQGRQLPYGCRDGACGACKSKLIEGRIDYQDRNHSALTEQEVADGMILLCNAGACSNVTIDAAELEAEAIPVSRYPARVERMERLCHDVMGLWLKLPNNNRMPFRAGQYINILLKEGRERSFSLANAPHDDEYLQLHIRYYSGGVFSEVLFNEMHEKAVLKLQGPLGSFCLDEESDRPMIFVAGGTGFAPIKGIIEHALAQGITRPMHLYCGVRAKRDLYMEPVVLDWLQANPQLRYIPVLSDPDASDDWDGEVGFVHQTILRDFPDLSGFDVYAGGPPVMVSAAHDAFLAQGLPPERFFSDPFEFSKDARAAQKDKS